ncbi:MAG TPA: hypothetical protein PLQ93_08210 [Bacteroidia bacterium]|nr:hypothetical protein [Bacteroidia bacterium]
MLNELLKALSVFLTCSVFLGKAGVPAAILLYKHSFIPIFIVCSLGGIAGTIVFTNLSAVILKQVHKYRARHHLIHKRKIFTRFNRRIVKIKNRFGLAGLAFISPMFLSIPLGTFLAERFFRKKIKIIFYFSVSVVFWVISLFLLSSFFYL